jgi:hypothetical protein
MPHQRIAIKIGPATYAQREDAEVRPLLQDCMGRAPESVGGGYLHHRTGTHIPEAQYVRLNAEAAAGRRVAR